MLAQVCAGKGQAFDFIKVWNRQDITPAMLESIEITSKLVHDDIMTPMAGISNISEWCKKESCWDRLQTKVKDLAGLLPDQFFEELITKDDVKEEVRTAVKTQKIDSGIEAQKTVMAIPASKWADILAEGQKKRLFSPKEIGILQIAARMPMKIPSEKQSVILLDVLEKAKMEAVYQD